MRELRRDSERVDLKTEGVGLFDAIIGTNLDEKPKPATHRPSELNQIAFFRSSICTGTHQNLMSCGSTQGTLWFKSRHKSRHKKTICSPLMTGGFIKPCAFGDATACHPVRSKGLKRPEITSRPDILARRAQILLSFYIFPTNNQMINFWDVPRSVLRGPTMQTSAEYDRHLCRGTSLTRNTHSPRMTIGPQA